MDKKSKIKLGLGLLIGTVLIIIGLNYGLRIKEDNLIALVVAMIVTSSSVFGTVISNKTNKKVEVVQQKVDKIEYKVNEIDVKQIAMDKGMYFVTEALKHIKEIDKLCVKIDNSASEILNGKHDLDLNFKNLVIQINDDVGTVIKKQYERGFEDFNPKTFKTIILNHIKLSVNNSLVDKELKEVLYTPIFDRTRDYIEKIKLICNTENGIRRKKFIQHTLLYTNTLTELSIDIYNKKTA